MPLVRISAGERRGLPLHNNEIAASLGGLAFFAAQNGIGPQRCVSGSLTDLTPTGAVYNNFRQFLEVEKRDPPEAGIIHLVPNVEGAQTHLLNPDGSLLRVNHKKVRIPQDLDAHL